MTARRTRRQASVSATDRPRFLTWTSAGHGDYTSDGGRRMRTTDQDGRIHDEPEPVDDERLASITDTASATHQDFTLRRAAEHGIRAVLRHEGTTDSATVKTRVAAALSCDVRTVERAARDMPDLQRRRGYRGATSWHLNSDTSTRSSESVLSLDGLRKAIKVRVYGERQAPFATDREIAAELMADHWQELMSASVALEHGDSTMPINHPPHDHDWRPADGRQSDAQRDVWRQGPGWRIAATRPD